MILSDLLDYSTLRIIWWVLLGLLLIGFAAMDGFDLGVETMLPFAARNDLERRMVLETIEPVWEGNQVWLILAGGAIFAAWPQLYAVSFSGFYLAMFIILFALILRPVGFKYRNKRESDRWRSGWDKALFIGGFVPSLIFGVAVGNVLLGVPFRINDDMMIFYEGSFFALLNPFALLAGVMSVFMLAMHGCIWLCVKTNGIVAERAKSYGVILALLTVAFYAAGGLYLWKSGLGYRITSEIDPNGPSNPLYKTAIIEQGAWLANYIRYPALLAVPALGLLSPFFVVAGLLLKKPLTALLFGKLAIFGIITSVGVAMFPFILPSSLDPNASLTVWDSSSSHLTLFIMLISTAIMLPTIMLYTSWVYYVLRGKVTEKDLEEGHY
ncbi:cytochrome d ubiquinol oxidase subunit II [Pseudochrobactrum sp. HB0163]|uniref:cytochrome d ubiquinol oxidase subunit II n=1 Tax=Pseudochrobactrum sp. HB0163 TaxID=3450708 RepID=UPI003F6DF23B